jgi:hypothetical protein
LYFTICDLKKLCTKTVYTSQYILVPPEDGRK